MNQSKINLDLYTGKGKRLSERKLNKMPECDWEPDKANTYDADKGLRDAVNVAISLGQPLLVTGEPGTGKTLLASSIKYELEIPGPFIFNAKTTSVARDLFYQYDALRHFQDAHTPGHKLEKQEYVQYNALGKAILLATPQKEIDSLPDVIKKHIPKDLISKEPTRSVVLIDEIDKTPRDLPNDILNEVLEMAFTVNETGVTHKASNKYRPIMIITSNSEKNLPEPFLRRCVFYHIDFPNDQRLKKIVKNHFGEMRFVDQAISHFQSIRKEKLNKKPATAEFLTWIMALQSLIHDEELDFKNLTDEQADIIKLSYSILVKSQEDLDLLKAQISENIS